MPFQALRALITRESEDDPKHESLHDMVAVIMAEPEVGSALQVFLETGKVMRTSPVQHVTRHGSELVVDTENSRYRLTLRAA